VIVDKALTPVDKFDKFEVEALTHINKKTCHNKQYLFSYTLLFNTYKKISGLT